MWLSGKGRLSSPQEESMAQLGEVTVAGQSPAVFLSGERRNIRTVAPGGYHWLPGERDTVLVMKTGGEEESCLLGKIQSPPKQLEQGSILISSEGESGVLLRGDGSVSLFSGQGSALHLKKDGTIRLEGTVYLNGEILRTGGEGGGPL